MSIQYQGRTLSEAEALTHVWDVEEVMEVMNRRVYYTMQGKHEEELRDLWVSTPELQKTASFGQNYGYYCGMEEIRSYYVTDFLAKRQEILDEFRAQDPTIENRLENRMIGYTSMAPNSTPLVEIAADGKTAQGVWYTIAQETVGRPEGRSEAMWRGEKLAADFVKEPEGWKIWHLVIANDYFNPAGPLTRPSLWTSRRARTPGSWSLERLPSPSCSTTAASTGRTTIPRRPSPTSPMRTPWATARRAGAPPSSARRGPSRPSGWKKDPSSGKRPASADPAPADRAAPADQRR